MQRTTCKGDEVFCFLQAGLLPIRALVAVVMFIFDPYDLSQLRRKLA